MSLSKKKFWAAFMVTFLIGFGFFLKTDSTKSKNVLTNQKIENKGSHSSTPNEYEIVSTSEIPLYASETLEYILEYDKAPAGYVGGRNFYNREKLLPQCKNRKKIRYKEWDIHPKIKGKNRGAERLVTSNLGTAYFTSDHYRSFKRIK